MFSPCEKSTGDQWGSVESGCSVVGNALKQEVETEVITHEKIPQPTYANRKVNSF